jgi:tRNA(Arg) A34 adenosine deaminase TadA
MEQAIDKAREGIKKGQLPFGACIVKDGRIVSLAHNTIYRDSNIIAHAETNAIQKACEKLNILDLSGCTIYCTCEPYLMCYGAISLSGIGCIVYGAEKEYSKIKGFRVPDITDEELNMAVKGNIEIVKGFMKEECVELFKLWEEQRN